MSLAGFIPTELMNQIILGKLNKSLVAGDVVSRDYEALLVPGGASVKIPSIGAVSASAYTRDSTITYSGLGGSSQNLELNKEYYYAYSVDDVNDALAYANVANQIVVDASHALRDSADSYLLTDLFVNGATTTSGTGARALGAAGSAVSVYGYGTGSLNGSGALAYLGRMSQRLDEADVPFEDRWCICPPWFNSYLVQEKCLTAPSVDANLAYANGRVGRAGGFDIRVSTNLTNYNAAASNIFCGHRKAVEFVGKVINSEIFKMRETKFAVGVSSIYVFGAVVQRPTGLAMGFISQA